MRASAIKNMRLTGCRAVLTIYAVNIWTKLIFISTCLGLLGCEDPGLAFLHPVSDGELYVKRIETIAAYWASPQGKAEIARQVAEQARQAAELLRKAEEHTRQTEAQERKAAEQARIQSQEEARSRMAQKYGF